jgi:polyisoprenoid-binding protein YceI
MRRHALIPIALVALAAPLAAQMVDQPLHGTGTPADVKAGSYIVEPAHTQVTFSVSHMGISPFAGTFSGASGSLAVDPANPGATKLTVTIPTGSVMTTSAKLTEELRSADWLDAAKFPTATFVSTRVAKLGGDAVQVDGNLTLHGVTKPATIRARLFGATNNPMSKKPSLGFLGRMVIQRTQFGVSKYVPLVSDETVLVINAAFERQ